MICPADQHARQNLLVRMQALHSICITALPFNGNGDEPSSRAYLGTKLVVSLYTGFSQSPYDLVKDASSSTVDKLTLLWKSCEHVVAQLKALDRSFKGKDIDRAFKLLYLATGLMYWSLSDLFDEHPDQDARFSTVLPLDELIAKINWTGTKSRLFDDLLRDLEGLQIYT